MREAAGGGRSSARLTAPIVAAGGIAKKMLNLKHGMEFLAYVSQVHDIKANIDRDSVTFDQVEATKVRCPDPEAAEEMIKKIKATQKSCDTVGGIVECVIRNVPPGLGEPLAGKLNADLYHSIGSINAVKAIEFGEGFGCVGMYGSEHNDQFEVIDGEVRTKTNHSGGIDGGISMVLTFILE